LNELLGANPAMRATTFLAAPLSQGIWRVETQSVELSGIWTIGEEELAKRWKVPKPIRTLVGQDKRPFSGK